MRRLVPLSLLVALPALAHEGELHARDVWNGVTAVVLACVLLIYVRGAFRSRPRAWQMFAFAAGWMSAAVALLSPLDRLSDVLFSAHMAQHEILMLVAAPLMVLGSPLVVMLWVFRAPARRRIGQLVRRPIVAGAWHRLTGPLAVLILHAVVLWVWHVPALFEAALRNETVHVFQHLGFFLTAALFWWALIHGRYGRAGYGVGVAYVFATAMHTQILGALLTFGNRIWYPTHAARTGAAALDDQQLAGVVMWIPFGVVFVLVALALFAAWIGEAERRVSFTSAARLTREEAPHA